MDLLDSDEMKAKMAKLNPDLQGLFLRYLREMYDQESDMMIHFIDESRRDLLEQTVDFSPEPEEQNNKKLTTVHGKKSTTTSSSNSGIAPLDEIDNKLAVERYMSKRQREATTHETNSRSSSFVHSPVPNGRGSASLPGTPESGASAHSLYEEIKQGNHKQLPKESTLILPSISPTGQNKALDVTPSPDSPTTRPSTITPLPSIASSTLSARAISSASIPDLQTDTEDEPFHQEHQFTEETQEIIRDMTQATAKIENERDRQRELVQQMKARKRAQQLAQAQMANSILEKAGETELALQKDKLRQEQKLREKLERKRREGAASTTHEVTGLDLDHSTTRTPQPEDQPPESKPKEKKKKKKKKKDKDKEQDEDNEEETEKKKKKKKKKDKDKEKDKDGEEGESHDDEKERKEKKKKKKKHKDKDKEKDEDEVGEGVEDQGEESKADV